MFPESRETWEFFDVLFMVPMQHELTEEEQEQLLSRGIRGMEEWFPFRL
jgi:hypothetical protein